MENIKLMYHFGDLAIDEKIILKWILNRVWAYGLYHLAGC